MVLEADTVGGTLRLVFSGHWVNRQQDIVTAWELGSRQAEGSPGWGAGKVRDPWDTPGATP